MNQAKSCFLYLHSGGVTPVLNKTLFTLIQLAEQYNLKCLVSPYGILGALREQFIELEALDSMAYTPASIMASSRHSPSDLEISHLIEILKKRNIHKLIIQGGDDSQKTLWRIQQATDIQCIGIPKTIDNDLFGIHTSPGYPSAAKYLGISFMEAAWDMLSMHHTSTKVFILETMGRNSGWLAAASTIASSYYNIPSVLCVPEHRQTEDNLLNIIDNKITKYGFCMLSLAEGYKFHEAQSEYKDSFGNPELISQTQFIANFINNKLKVKVRYSRPDCLQRSAGHMISKYDFDLSETLAISALNALKNEENAIMIGTKNAKLSSIIYQPLELITNNIQHLKHDFLSIDGSQISNAFVEYLSPLIQGEINIPYKNGLPDYYLPINLHESKI